MSIPRILDRYLYRHEDWRTVLGCWINAIEQLLQCVALLAVIGVAFRWLAYHG